MVALLLAVSALPLASQAAPPHAKYRTFDTPHFRVVYAEGLREVALRAAAHAEEAHRILREEFLPPPPGPIELVVTDHSDHSNAFASSTPRPRMILWARPQMDATPLNHFDEWLGLVSMHELAHVFHLERGGAAAAVLRRVFGRAPHSWPFFPSHLLPTFAVEGAAVQVESAHTDAGRLHGTHHRSVVRAHALDGRTERLGQALGSSPAWPGGVRPYVYGSLFFEWMEARYGPGAVGEFLEHAGAQWVPFRLSAAARRATGRSLEQLWEEWSEEAAREAAERAGTQAAAGRGARSGAPEAGEREPLTRGARNALYPAPHPAGDGFVYLRSDGRSETRMVWRGAGGQERTLTRWNDLSRAIWAPGGDLLATQPDYVDRWRLRRDLYRIEPDGRVRRLTRGMRIAHVDAHPVTGQIAAVQEVEGTNRLILLTPEGRLDRVLREADAEVHWAFPRWSPDGETLAVVRWRRGGRMGVVLLRPGAQEGAGGRARTGDRAAAGGRAAAGERGAASEPALLEDRSLHTAPTWSPDGQWVLWASDRDGGMNVYARGVEHGLPVGPVRQVTFSPTAASQPAVDAEGRRLLYSELGADGWDLVQVAFDPASWGDPAGLDPRFVAGSGPHAGVHGATGAQEAAAGVSHVPGGPPPALIIGEDRPWSPLPSLLPTYWLPLFAEPESVRGHRVLPWAVGAETSGRDVVGRNAWSLRATASPREPSGRAEVSARWRWAGLGQPALLLSLDQRVRAGSFIAPEEAPGDTLYPVTRERSAGVDAELRRQRVRSVASLSVGVHGVRERRTLLEADGEASTRFDLTRPRQDLAEVRVGASFSTVRSFALGISPGAGWGATGRLRARRDLSVADTLAGRRGADGSFQDALAAARGFVSVPSRRPLPGFAPATFGVRVAAGVARGPGAGRGHFRIGGGGGGGAGRVDLLLDGANPTFSVRGLPLGVYAGDRAWAASAELRLPVANLHRGHGALPVHLDRAAASLFVDVAGAGRPPLEGGKRAWEHRASAGAEATLSHTLLFGNRSQLRGGIAMPLEAGARPGFYLQTGWSF